MANFNTGVPSLDPNELKKALKEFLQGQDEFNSYNFDGSALSTILDLLTKNTHYLSYIANMMAQESFLQRAQIRENVVEHAQKLSYVPGSKTCSKAIVNIVVRPDESTVDYPQFITMPVNTAFAGQYASEVVTFTNQEEYALYLNASDNTYVRNGVELYHGDFIEESFVYDGINSSFIISNPNIDITTLHVSVQNSSTDLAETQYARASSIIDVNPTSPIYFLYETENNKYRIEFGDNILGKALENGNIVNVHYMAANTETIANGITSLSLISDIDGFVDATVQMSVPSYGGSDRESIEQIKKMAPIGWAAQDRSVTPDDYIANLKRLFPQAKSAISWGGEDNIPPRFGSVFIAINTVDGNLLVQEVKNEIQKLLKTTNVGSITPVVVDPSYVDIDLNLSVGYDAFKSNSTVNKELLAVSSLCIEYSNDYLEDFGRHFISSELASLIKNVRPSIVSVDVEFDVTKFVEVSLGSESLYTVLFDNPILPSSIEAKGFKIYPTDVDTRMYDDGNGGLKIDRLENGVRKILVNNAGTVDYETGEVKFTFTPISTVRTDSRVGIKMTPKTSNYLALRENILRVSSINVSENLKVRKG